MGHAAACSTKVDRGRPFFLTSRRHEVLLEQLEFTWNSFLRPKSLLGAIYVYTTVIFENLAGLSEVGLSEQKAADFDRRERNLFNQHHFY